MNMERLKEGLWQGSWTIGQAILILVLGWMLVAWLMNVLDKRMRVRKVDQTVMRFVLTFLRFTLRLIVIVMAISALGNFSATLAAILGASALSVGLALQGALSNLAGGILLVVFRPFKLGHFIESNGESGSVEDIGILTTTLRTVDNKQIFLPNGKVAGETIVNYSSTAQRRVDLNYLMDENADLNLGRQLLLDMVKEDQRVLEKPEVNLHIVEQSEGRLRVTLKVWTATEDYWDVYWEFMERGREQLLQAGLYTSSATMRLEADKK